MNFAARTARAISDAGYVYICENSARLSCPSVPKDRKILRYQNFQQPDQSAAAATWTVSLSRLFSRPTVTRRLLRRGSRGGRLIESDQTRPGSVVFSPALHMRHVEVKLNRTLRYYLTVCNLSLPRYSCTEELLRSICCTLRTHRVLNKDVKWGRITTVTVSENQQGAKELLGKEQFPLRNIGRNIFPEFPNFHGPFRPLLEGDSGCISTFSKLCKSELIWKFEGKRKMSCVGFLVARNSLHSLWNWMFIICELYNMQSLTGG